MNKKQLIILWVMGIAIITIALTSPLTYRSGFYLSKSKTFVTPIFFIRNIIPVLIIGGLLLYTLHRYPQFSFLKLFKTLFKAILIAGSIALIAYGIIYTVQQRKKEIDFSRRQKQKLSQKEAREKIKERERLFNTLK
jgi:uncharacterized protein YacL